MSVINSNWNWNSSNGSRTEQKGNDGDDASIASTSSSYWTSLPDTKVIQLVRPVTGRPRMLRFMGSQRVRHDRATELNWLLALSFSYYPTLSLQLDSGSELVKGSMGWVEHGCAWCLIDMDEVWPWLKRSVLPFIQGAITAGCSPSTEALFFHL